MNTSCAFPGWLDVLLIIFLSAIKKIYSLHDIDLTVMILVAGFVRYVIQIFSIGLTFYSSKNLYIKQTIVFFVALLLVFTYDQNTFTWLFALYYSELVAFELAASIIKRIGRI